MSLDLYPAPVAPNEPSPPGRPLWLLVPIGLLVAALALLWWILTPADDPSEPERTPATTTIVATPTTTVGDGASPGPDTIAVAYWEMRIGDCFLSPDYGEDWSVGVVPCGTPHGFEMYEVFFLDDTIEATVDAIDQAASAGCAAALPAAASIFGSWVPTVEELGDGFLDIGCYAILDSERIGSIRTPIPAGPIADQVYEVMAAVEDLRGLAFLSVPEIELIPGSELVEGWEQLVAEDLAAGDPLCELFRPADPCGEVGAQAIAAQILAYYDGETGIITVPLEGETLSPWERASLAHELSHSLTDGHFRWAATGNQLWWEGSTDAWYALNAVIEGDAQLLEGSYIAQYLDPDETIAYDQAYEELARDAPPTPLYWEAEATFTYVEGLEYVSALVEAGGFDALNQAYLRPAPATEWILSGPDGVTDRPVAVDGQLPFSPNRYYLTSYGDWGALEWYQLLWEDPNVTEIVAGWGGGGYSLYEDGRGELLLSVTHVGDDVLSVQRLYAALIERLPTTMAVDSTDPDGWTFTATGDDYLWIDLEGIELRLLVAQDPGDGKLVMHKLVRWEDAVEEGVVPTN